MAYLRETKALKKSKKYTHTQPHIHKQTDAYYNPASRHKQKIEQLACPSEVEQSNKFLCRHTIYIAYTKKETDSILSTQKRVHDISSIKTSAGFECISISYTF